MSFSEQIKQEILNKIGMKSCCKKAIRYGELFVETNDIKKSEIKEIISKTCCRKSFIKGVFLNSGYIVSPNMEYHFEVTLNTKFQADYIMELLLTFGIKAKLIKRNKCYVVYIKDSETISNVLRLLEAPVSLMEFENARIKKSIKNDINRNINCEAANINKIVTSSYKQIQAIQKLEKSEVYKTLSNETKELCILRKNNPDMSLEELGKIYSQKLSKSGIYHRLNKIVKIAEKL